MNVRVAHKLYMHVVYENYNNIEWLKITNNNVLFKDAKYTTHVIPIKRIVEFSVTQ